MNWQKEHERLMTEMAWLVGASAATSGSIRKALANVTNPTTLSMYQQLNHLNSNAVRNYLRGLPYE